MNPNDPIYIITERELFVVMDSITHMKSFPMTGDQYSKIIDHPIRILKDVKNRKINSQEI